MQEVSRARHLFDAESTVQRLVPHNSDRVQTTRQDDHELANAFNGAVVVKGHIGQMN